MPSQAPDRRVYRAPPFESYKISVLVKKILVTGGAGFIGSAVIRQLIDHTNHQVLNYDKLTYAGDLDSLVTVSSSDRYRFVKGDICNRGTLDEIFESFSPDIVMHLAAESHVDRSIDGPATFIETNIIGTFHLLEASLWYWKNLSIAKQESFRFHHVSTDEVYGDLDDFDDLFSEVTAYRPSSPYSASKASSDHLVRAWGRTYGLPTLVTNCSNNYGPYHFPEKLIPHTIIRAISGQSIPVYGDGGQIRDWLYVEDHARALELVAIKGAVGETYNIGGHNEVRNIDVVCQICSLLEEFDVDKPVGIALFKDLITFVADRPGHDVRYAIDARKVKETLGWTPRETFETGLKKTVQWYLENDKWWSRVISPDCYVERLGQGERRLKE